MNVFFKFQEVMWTVIKMRSTLAILLIEFFL